MRYLKKPELPFGRRLARLARMCAAAGCLAAAMPAQARDISVEYAGSELVGGNYYADARIHFDLDEDTLVALEHGVAVDIKLFLRVRRDRKWLWDPLVAETTLHFRLQHHPLSNDFVVSDETSAERHQFPTADAALKYLGAINNHPLVDQSLLQPEHSYSGYVKARLSMESLPAPLQPAAYVSGTWQTESSWYEWVLR
jgi:hypothetical protein